MSRDEKELFLLRHAKSSWEDPDLADHDRPLAPRGRRASKTIAEHMQRERIKPTVVLCSSARRAQETVERIVAALGDSEVVIEPGLYHASAGDLLARLRALPESSPSVMLVGHNPAMQELALALAGSGREAVEGKYPTAGLATFRFGGGWSELEYGSAELSAFVTPKGLKGSH
jgi:phosphohistidine phosphatase